MTEELQKTIEELYIAFEGYRRRPFTDPCCCHHTPEQERRLHSGPLRSLTAADLKEYAFDALYTWGTELDFKHFLPRLFELVVTTDNSTHDFVDPQALFRKLPYASWWLWPESERTSIMQFVRALWRAALASTPEELNCSGIGDWICSIAQFEENLLPYFDDWLSDESESAYRNLAQFVLEELPFSKRVPPAYWEDRREHWNQLLDWLRTPAVRQKLEHGVERWSDTDLGNELYEAAVLLQ